MRLPVKSTFVAVLLAAQLASADLSVRVAVVRSGSVGPFNEATSAIVDELRRQLRQPEILTFDLEGDEAASAATMEDVHRFAPQLIVAVGSLATAAVMRHAGDTPVVFSMVLYPRQSGFLSEPRRITGASLDIPLDVQFSYLRRLFPSARRVGVLYSAEETGTIIAEARKAAAAHDFELVAQSVSDPAHAVADLTQLMERVDVLWSIADSHVWTAQTTSALILASLRRHIPLFGLSAAHVRAGAVAALSCDYADVGRQTAELAVRVLAGEPPKNVQVSTPRRLSLALNLRSAERLDVSVPEDLQAEAREIVR